MKRNFRIATVHIVLVTMMLRAFMPAGWMPAANASPGLPFTICTVNGPVQLDPDTDSQPAKQKQSHDDVRHPGPCPFATMPHMAQAVAAMDLLPPSPIATAARLVTHRAAAVQSERYALHSPRAPPRFV
jgi:hypothetical protein